MDDLEDELEDILDDVEDDIFTGGFVPSGSSSSRRSRTVTEDDEDYFDRNVWVIVVTTVISVMILTGLIACGCVYYCTQSGSQPEGSRNVRRSFSAPRSFKPPKRSSYTSAQKSTVNMTAVSKPVPQTSMTTINTTQMFTQENVDDRSKTGLRIVDLEGDKTAGDIRDTSEITATNVTQDNTQI